jgi:hypothetical protein
MGSIVAQATNVIQAAVNLHTKPTLLKASEGLDELPHQLKIGVDHGLKQ